MMVKFAEDCIGDIPGLEPTRMKRCRLSGRRMGAVSFSKWVHDPIGYGTSGPLHHGRSSRTANLKAAQSEYGLVCHQGRSCRLVSTTGAMLTRSMAPAETTTKRAPATGTCHPTNGRRLSSPTFLIDGDSRPIHHKGHEVTRRIFILRFPWV